MSRIDDRRFHELRAQQERELAETASDPFVAGKHRALAALHQQRLAELQEPPAHGWTGATMELMPAH